MELIVTIAALTAIASASVLYANKETDEYAHQQFENYANTAEMYQTAVEHQQQHVTHSANNQPGAAPIASNLQHQSRPLSTARIINYIFDNDGHNYHYTYETENGSYQEAASRYYQQQSKHENQHYQSSGQPAVSSGSTYHAHQ